MHFADELADPEKLHVPKKMEVGKREMNMAKSLIDSMSSKWNPEKYKDDYREALMDVIEEKVEAGGQEIEEKPRKAPKPTKVIDLVSVLQKSLEETGGKRKAKGKSRGRKTHPSRKAAYVDRLFRRRWQEELPKAQISGGEAAFLANALRTTRSTC